MGRRSSGLRNRFRTGRSTYSVKGKHRERDRYGTRSQGRQLDADVVAGHALWYRKELKEDGNE